MEPPVKIEPLVVGGHSRPRFANTPRQSGGALLPEDAPCDTNLLKKGPNPEKSWHEGRWQRVRHDRERSILKKPGSPSNWYKRPQPRPAARRRGFGRLQSESPGRRNWRSTAAHGSP